MNTAYFTTTWALSKYTGIRHQVLILLIQRYKVHFKHLGDVALSISEREKVFNSPRSIEYFNLSFNQALLLLSLISNSRHSVKLKREMVAWGNNLVISDLLLSFDVADLDDDFFIYVALINLSGKYKLGASKNPDARIRHLNAKTKDTITLIIALPVAELKNNKGYDAPLLRYHEEKYQQQWFNDTVRLCGFPDPA